MKNSFLNQLLLILFAAPAVAQEQCKVWQPARLETREVGVQPSDWSWSCNSINALEGSVFNSTKNKTRKIIITGTSSKKAVGKSVQISPNTSYDFYFSSGNGICGVDKNARMKFETTVSVAGYCKTRYTNIEWEAKRKKEEEQKRKNAAQKRKNAEQAEIQRRKNAEQAEIQRVKDEIQAELQAKQDILYNNCVISKSKGVDSSVISSVRSVCREIAKKPSAWQKFRWGP